MPCDSSYLQPHQYEIEIAKTAELLCFAKEFFGIPVGDHEKKYSRAEAYPSHEDGDIITANLCSLLSALTESEFNKTFKNLKDIKTLQLRTRRLEHQKADKKRIAKEKLELEQARIKKDLTESALAKLSPEEKNALGIR